MGKRAQPNAHTQYEIELAQIHKEQYIQTYIKLVEELEQTPQCKGTLVQKKHKRKKAGKLYIYQYFYIQTIEYKDGKRKTKRKYISKDQLTQIQEQYQTRAPSPTRSKLKECERHLKRYIRQGLLPSVQNIQAEAGQRYKEQKQATIYRKKQVIQAKEKPAYKIKTEAGELVLSKNECIVANMLHHKGIPYFYEKPIQLKPRKDGKPVILHPDFTIHVNGTDIYIEVLGMMDTEAYANSWEYRRTTYKINGIHFGKNLVALQVPQDVDCGKLRQALTALAKHKMPKDVVYCGI